MTDQIPFAAKPRKRHTGLLFSTAAVLGLIGGVGGGYAIQKHRAPTPLPSLYVALPAQNKVPGTLPTASADDLVNDDQARLDGDIRKLLVDKPSGTKDWADSPWPDGWETSFDYAISRDPAFQATSFRDLNNDGLRRIAARGWQTTDGFWVSVELIQFRDTEGAQKYLPHTDLRFPNTLEGTYRVWDTKDAAGFYAAEADALHGTVLVQVTATSETKKVPSAMVTDLAQKQLVKL